MRKHKNTFTTPSEAEEEVLVERWRREWQEPRPSDVTFLTVFRSIQRDYPDKDMYFLYRLLIEDIYFGFFDGPAGVRKEEQWLSYRWKEHTSNLFQQLYAPPATRGELTRGDDRMEFYRGNWTASVSFFFPYHRVKNAAFEGTPSRKLLTLLRKTTCGSERYNERAFLEFQDLSIEFLDETHIETKLNHLWTSREYALQWVIERIGSAPETFSMLMPSYEDDPYSATLIELYRADMPVLEKLGTPGNRGAKTDPILRTRAARTLAKIMFARLKEGKELPTMTEMINLLEYHFQRGILAPNATRNFLINKTYQLFEKIADDDFVSDYPYK